MKYKVRLRDKIYEVEVERGEAILVDEYAAAAPAPTAAAAAPTPVPAAAAAPVAAGADAVCAPLPGSVVDVKVSVGESVKKGQILLLIEAMKMENEIVAPNDGVVKAIHTSKGASVTTGAPLVTLG
ncbi:MAG: biotin/lipoyl-binding protein [Oscillospiraceae bacterium]|nr:biotin/lipoyl-binding protein [Oscillospiraceae bacterium]